MATNVQFRNPSIRNSVRITQQDSSKEDIKDPKQGTITRLKWQTVAHVDVKPNEHADFWVGATRRVIIEEIPT